MIVIRSSNRKRSKALHLINELLKSKVLFRRFDRSIDGAEDQPTLVLREDRKSIGDISVGARNGRLEVKFGA